jgi:hypothetical protein
MLRTVPGVELSATRLSAGFGQPALDYHFAIKKPDVVVTPGFKYSSGRYGPMSRAQWIEREQIRRMIGDRPFPSSLFATQPY